jgi:hypothetical protein
MNRQLPPRHGEGWGGGGVNPGKGEEKVLSAFMPLPCKRNTYDKAIDHILG